jgi:hypothetical protein
VSRPVDVDMDVIVDVDMDVIVIDDESLASAIVSRGPGRFGLFIEQD